MTCEAYEADSGGNLLAHLAFQAGRRRVAGE